MVQKRGLGRGLGALIPGAESPRPTTQEVALDQIEANPFQPRRTFGAEALETLAATIKEHGVLTPIVLRKGPGGYQIIAGERRVRAARKVGLTTIPAIIKDATDGQALQMALVENLQREDLNPLESAEAYQRLMEEFGLTQEDIAGRLGRDRSSVANALRLLRLPLKIRDDIATGALTEGHARALLGIDVAAEQIRARDMVVKKGLSVRETEALVRRWRGNGKGTRKHAVGSADPNLAELEDQLRAALGTKVRIVREGGGGTVHVSFFSADDLTRIVEAIAGPR